MKWIKTKFAKKPEYIESNILALRAGNIYCEATEQFAVSYDVKPAFFEPAPTVTIEGNMATVLGLIAASRSIRVYLSVSGSYPITPASDIFTRLAQYRNFGVITMQMEDEIAAVGVAIGAAFSGSLGVTGSSGPGLALKSEAINLAMIAELPLVVCNIQRAGPSTGMRQKRNSRIFYRCSTVGTANPQFLLLLRRVRTTALRLFMKPVEIAVKYRTPVIFLSDLYIGMGAEPWRIPKLSELPEIRPDFAVSADTRNGFEPYLRESRDLGASVGETRHRRLRAPHRRFRKIRCDGTCQLRC